MLLDEFLECLTVLSDYIDVSIHGAPPIHLLFQEVGLQESEFDRCRRGAHCDPKTVLVTGPGWPAW